MDSQLSGHIPLSFSPLLFFCIHGLGDTFVKFLLRRITLKDALYLTSPETLKK